MSLTLRGFNFGTAAALWRRPWRGVLQAWWSAMLAMAGLSQAAGPIINEIHYDPEHQADASEFVEIYNPNLSAADLSGWALTNAVEFVFPAGTVIGPGGYVVVGEDPNTLAQRSGVEALGPFQKRLGNQGDRVVLVDSAGSIMDEVEYQSTFPWPVAAGGEGSSMELIHPNLDNSLGGSWRSSVGAPTPGRVNSVFSATAPPQIRQVAHAPRQPAAGGPIIISAKVTDPDGVQFVQAKYQIVRPGFYRPSHLALTRDQLLASPNTPLPPNPEFENPANWMTISMRDDGGYADAKAGDNIYTGVIPAQANRTLVRYRIEAADMEGVAVQVPYPDDPSLNFACFVYDGVPAWRAESSVHLEGVGHVYSREVMRSLPVYFLLTRSEDMAALEEPIPMENPDARGKFNWEGAFVYDGVVYDHIHFRLRHSTSRYDFGKKSMRFDFNRGHHFQAKNNQGIPYPTQWKKLNLGRMFDSRGVYNFGLVESMNSSLWNLLGVPAPLTHWLQLRVVDQPSQSAQAPSTTNGGDFFGLFLALEDYDSRFIDAHQMPDGNLYKLEDQVFDPIQLLRHQGKDSVTNGLDFATIHNELRPGQPDTWLRTHVNWDKWYRYAVIQDAIRHDDYNPSDTHLKNRAWFFEPANDNPLGRLWVLPWDTDSSWGPNWGGSGGYARQAIFQDAGKSQFRIEYRNLVREFRDLLWQESVIGPMIEKLAAPIEEITRADQDRWRVPRFDSLANKVLDMKNFAFQGWSGAGGDPVEAGGRAAFLDALSESEGDAESIPLQPEIRYTGPSGFPINALTFESGPFRDPQGDDTFKWMEWRVAEVTDPTSPSYDPSAPLLLEWNANWSSGALRRFNPKVSIPPEAVAGDHTYRIRLRWADSTGRWSHWSAPIQFVPTLPETARGIRDYLRVTEVMFHPAGAGGEFVELLNTGPTALDIHTVRVEGGVAFDFQTSAVTELAPGESVVIVENEAVFRSRYPDPNIKIAGAYSGQLSNGGEILSLSERWAGKFLEFEYRDDWYPETDGQGFSLVPNTDGMEPAWWTRREGWRPSDFAGGSPGRVSPNMLPAPSSIVINEILPSNGSGESGWVELANVGPSPADLSGWCLSDDASFPRKYHFEEGTVLPAGSFLQVKAEQTFSNPALPNAFALDPRNGTLLLSSMVNGEPGSYRTDARYGVVRDGESWGRAPAGGNEAFLVLMRRATPGEPNTDAADGPVTISEVFLNSPGTPNAEFVELFNRGVEPIDLGGGSVEAFGREVSWELEGVAQFVFPAGTIIPPQQFLVVTRGDPQYVREQYQVPTAVPVIGPAAGNWSGGGQTVALVARTHDNSGDLPQRVFEEVVNLGTVGYLTAGQTGAGISVARLFLDASSEESVNWIGSVPSPGRLKWVNGDHDAIPDDWERANGADPTDPTDTVEDSDGDSQTTWNEYIAGTDPLDPADHVSLGVALVAGQCQLSLQTRKASGPGYENCVRRYMLERRLISASNWTAITGWIIGEGQKIVFDDTVTAPQDARFYRAVVQLDRQTNIPRP